MEATGRTIDVLLIEDDPGAAYLVNDMLDEFGEGRIRLEQVRSRNDGEERLRAARFDVVLLDLGLPESTGLATLRHMRERFPEQAFIVLSGLDDADTARDAICLGARGYLVKGAFREDVLMRAIMVI